MNEVLVSISCLTYNQAPYIRQCLEGLIMQKTNFKFEILIHDDASTDGTQDIIKEYQDQYPEMIFPIYQTENQYSQGVRGMMIRFNFPRAKGKYIALCEGDDYWTDSLKLQKQINFLEANEDYTLCFHNVNELLPNGEMKPSPMNVEINTTFTIKDLAKRNFIHTPSVVYRKNSTEYPKWFFSSPVGDYPMHLIHASKGKLYCMAETMAVYRVGSGIWSSQSLLKTLHNWKLVLENLQGNFSEEINKLLIEQKENIENRIKSEQALIDKNKGNTKSFTKRFLKKWF